MESSVELIDLVARIKEEADSRRAEGWDVDEAYRQAVAEVFRQVAESLDVSPFEVRLMEDIRELAREYEDGVVPTKHIASRRFGGDTWKTWYHLKKLEQRGLLQRPRGPRSGWQLVA